MGTLGETSNTKLDKKFLNPTRPMFGVVRRGKFNWKKTAIKQRKRNENGHFSAYPQNYNKKKKNL